MSNTIHILAQALEHAKALGMDQRELASQAGLRQETISRAKKRGTLDSSSLDKILGCVGLELALRPKEAPVPTSLRHPSWGLVWSNPSVEDDVLIRKALLGAGFTVILQAAVEFGLPRLRQQWAQLISSESPAPGTRELVNRILTNIEEGFEHAAS